MTPPRFVRVREDNKAGDLKALNFAIIARLASCDVRGPSPYRVPFLV
jgi:hypothetical protein